MRSRHATLPAGGLVSLALGLALVPSLEAQTLRGTVLDAATGEPVVLAYVGLLAEGRELVVADLADAGGTFNLDAPAAGSYFLMVSRTGYDTLMDGLFELGEDGVFDVRIGLTPKPIELDPVEVSASRSVSPLEASGFYDRVLTAPGHFFSREEVMSRSVNRVSDVFRNVPRVSIDESRPLTGPRVMQHPAVVMQRGTETCHPTLYIDRHVVATGVNQPIRPDDYVAASEIEAVEVYTRATQVPPEFDAINGCGVILIWTRLR